MILLPLWKKYLKKEKKDVIYLDYNELMHNPEIELEKIKNIIPDFDKAVIEVKLKSKK